MTLSPACVILYILQLSLPSMFTVHMVFKCQSYTKYEMSKKDLHYSASLMQLVCCFANNYSDILEYSMRKKAHKHQNSIISDIILFLHCTQLCKFCIEKTNQIT